MGEIIARRQFAPLYIRLDLAFLLLFALLLIIYNLRQKEPAGWIRISWLLAIGILVQFGWEAGLLLGGVRSAGFSFAEKLRPLIVNSLLETNLGLPYIYLIFIALTGRYTEDLKKRPAPLSFSERVRENTRETPGKQSAV